MISREEYIRLYCDEAMVKATGVPVICPDKLAKRLDSDPMKTISDLVDYDLVGVKEEVSSDLSDYGLFDPDLFDWGDEDSIK